MVERVLPEQNARNFLLRTASGSGVVVAIVCGLYLGGWFWFCVAGFIGMVSLWEYYCLVRSQFHVSSGIGMIAGLSAIVLTGFSCSDGLTLAVFPVACIGILILEILRRQSTKSSDALRNLGGTLSGVAYVVLPWCLMIYLRYQNWGFLVLLTLFLCTWATDVTAYVAGMQWGEKPFFPFVSPKKTLEGAAGGLLGSLFAASLISFALAIPPIPLLLIGLICGTLGQFGDLGESVLKREAHKKNSGALIPGHGGMLDRFDSILFNASCVFILFEVVLK
ncbi:MAG: phosphatidate cytidylyltransferase [Synergistales bacterium]|nr:phosphatidate cytidylyltransferase [Synergistales bacterium]